MGESMNDLFESIQEDKEERQAIKMADGIITTQEELHRCEVLTLSRRYLQGDDLKPFFADVEKHRGKESADKLRSDTWAKCQAEQSAMAEIRRKVDQDKVQK
jgi:hypothetical protein